MISPIQMIILRKLLNSVDSVWLFIALYEKIHFCKGETIELFSMPNQCPKSAQSTDSSYNSLVHYM